MKTYLTAAEGFKIKDQQQLISDIIELYTYHYKQATDLHNKLYDADIDDEDISEAEENAYILGKADGANEILSAIILSAFGGGVAYDIWQKTMEWIK